MKCVICKKRPAVPDDWKTEREKETCFTCHTVELIMKIMAEQANMGAMDKKVPIKLSIQYEHLEKN